MTAGAALAVPHDWLPPAVAVAVAAPLVAAVVAAAGLATGWLRLLACGSSSLALAAGLVAALAVQSGDGGAWAWGPALGGGRLVYVDGLGATLLPYTALVSLAIALVAPRRMLDAVTVRRMLLGFSATLALFASSHPLVLVILWIVTAQPTWRAARTTPGGRPAARVFAAYMTTALVCMAAGTFMLVADPPWERSSGAVGTAGGWLVAAAVMIRKGIFPFHSWYPALFSGVAMSTALRATQPQVAAYTAVRLLVGHADGVPYELDLLSTLALVTAVYGAALAFAERELRGFVGALAMSQSALVLAGLAGTLPMELTGAFCVWISSGLALTGIGLVTWALESRAGDIPLDTLQGRFWDAPALAAFFLLFGMASIGFPGTLSFVADDLIVSGSLEGQVGDGLMVIASTVLCGIAVMRCWFTVFGGPTGTDSPRHEILLRERVSFTVLLAVLFGLGLWPGPLVRSLDRAAAQILRVLHDPHSSAPASSPAPLPRSP
jgi:NADH-quinone oxidoreductase subunit M